MNLPTGINVEMIEQQGGGRDFIDCEYSISTHERRELAIEALRKLDAMQRSATGITTIDLAELLKIRCAIRIGLGISLQ